MNGQKSVSDLGAAAYLLMHNYRVIGRGGKDIYFSTAAGGEQEFDRLTLDYLSSEFHRFDSCLMSLKKLGEYPPHPECRKFVTDLGAAAYLLMHKYRISGKRGRAVYFEVDDADEFEEVSLQYLSSDFHRFDSCLMSLKKIPDYVAQTA